MHHGWWYTEQIWVSSCIMCLDEHPPKQVKIWTQKINKFHSRVTHLKNSVQNYFSTFSHHVMHHNLLPVNVRKCMTMSQPPGLLPAFINFKWLTQIIDVEVVWCEVLSHHPFCTTVDLTGQKKRLYIFCHINLIMVSDSDGFIVVCFEIQILFALHTKPNDRRHKLIQRLGHVKLKHEKRKRK